MNSPNSREEEIRRREKELQEREYALRLRELETEIYQQAKPGEPPILPTVKHQPTESAMQQRLRQVINVVKFLGIVVAVVVAVRIASALAYAVIIGAIAWIGYKVFLEKGNRSKR